MVTEAWSDGVSDEELRELRNSTRCRVPRIVLTKEY